MGNINASSYNGNIMIIVIVRRKDASKKEKAKNSNKTSNKIEESHFLVLLTKCFI